MFPLKEKYLPLATIKKWSQRETAFNRDKVGREGVTGKDTFCF